MAAAPAKKISGLDVSCIYDCEPEESATLQANVFNKMVLLISAPHPQEIITLLEEVITIGKRKFEDEEKKLAVVKQLKKDADRMMNETPLQRLVANCPDPAVAPGLYTLGNPPRPIPMPKNEPSFRFGSGVPEPFKPADQEKTADSEQAAVTKSVDLTKE